MLYGFPCEMDFSPLVFVSHPRRKRLGGIRRLVVRKGHLTWKIIQNAYVLAKSNKYKISLSYCIRDEINLLVCSEVVVNSKAFLNEQHCIRGGRNAYSRIGTAFYTITQTFNPFLFDSTTNLYSQYNSALWGLRKIYKGKSEPKCICR